MGNQDERCGAVFKKYDRSLNASFTSLYLIRSCQLAWRACSHRRYIYSLTVIQLPNRFFEIPYTTVHELGTLATGTRAKIVSFDDSDFQSSCGCVECDSRTCGTAPNDKKIIGIAIIVWSTLDRVAFQARNLFVPGFRQRKVWRHKLAFAVARRRNSWALVSGNITRTVRNI